MTELFVACRNITVKGSDGALYRLVKGRTIAEGGHPAVTDATRDSFMPYAIDLPAPEAEATEPGGETLAALVEDRDRYLEQLVAVGELLRGRGLLDGVDMTVEGWLVARLGELLPAAAEPEPVVAPRAAAKPRKAAASKPPADE